VQTEAKRTTDHAIRDQVGILNIAEGFFHSSVLFALLKLRIFELIGDRDKSVDELAADLKTSPQTLARLLNAGVALKLLECQSPCKYRLTPMSRSVLVPSVQEGFIGNWVRNLSYFQAALSKLDEAVLTSGPTVDSSLHLGTDQIQTDSFIMAMHDYASLRGKELARYLDTSRCESLLDLGCGPGTYAFHLGMVNPNLKLYLMDLRPVLQIARQLQTKYMIRNNIQYLACDILRDDISGQYDLILVSNTLHMLGHEVSSALIERLYKSVKPGGSLVIQAQFLRDDMTGERWPVLLDLIQLCITDSGANHSVAQTKSWMEDAGFRDLEFHPMSLLNSNSFLRGFKR
jgi:SAM-dependent methyltransferase